jgi:hypothetical protein
LLGRFDSGFSTAVIGFDCLVLEPILSFVCNSCLKFFDSFLPSISSSFGSPGQRSPRGHATPKYLEMVSDVSADQRLSMSGMMKLNKVRRDREKTR